MAEPSAGPSTIPVITVSTHNQTSAEEDSTSSSCNSPTLTALETPNSPEPEPEPEAEASEPTQTNEFSADIPVNERDQTPISPPKSTISPSESSGGHDTLPPRTQSGVPVSLKRKHASQSKPKKSTPQTQADEHPPWHGVVVDYAPQKEQAVLFPAKMVYSSPNIPYNNESWAFQRATGYSDFIGSGFIFFKVNGEKKRKNVKDNTYVFIVLEGAVEVLIHQTSYAVSAGGVFIVPRGNDYTIRNISEKEAKLFFTQTRRPEPETTVDTNGVGRPSSKSFAVAEWLLQRIIAHFLRLRANTFDWYWKNLAKYRHYFTTRRLYFLFFVLGLMIRRLPFIGSPPILNIQIIRLR